MTIWTLPAFQFSFPLNMKQFRDVAGLLTCFLFRASFPSFSDSGSHVPDELRETHSSGSVQDFHLIPFSSPGRIARRGHHSRHYSVANVARRIHSSKCSHTNLRRLFPVFPPPLSVSLLVLLLSSSCKTRVR